MREYYLQRIAAFKLKSTLFRELGNTGSAVQHILYGYDTAANTPLHIDRNGAIREAVSAEEVRNMIRFRHPDPHLLPGQQLKDPELQVRGSWQKIRLAHRRRIPSRMGFVAFVYNSIAPFLRSSG
jgi:hypothetical protein